MVPPPLKLAFEEARRWKSYSPKVDLSPDIPGIIRDFMRRLSSPANHGKVLVSHSMGYLAAAKNGLTEDELLDVLSLDKTVFEDFADRAHHELTETKLPVVGWLRLYHDLETHLTERIADGTIVLSFYHRQLSEVVYDVFLNESVKQKRHRLLANYFNKQPLWQEGQGKRSPNVRKVSELPYQQTNGEQWDAVEKTLCDLYFIEAKCAAGRTYELIADYNSALEVLPEALREKDKDLEHKERLKKYFDDLITFSRREIVHFDTIPSVETWSDEKIRRDIDKIIDSPTQLERIRAFAQFVSAEAPALVMFGNVSGFCLQQAFNAGDSGPLADVAENNIHNKISDVLILQPPSHRARYNPYPALIGTFYGHKRKMRKNRWERPGPAVNYVSFSFEGNRLLSGSQDGTFRVWDIESGLEIIMIQMDISKPRDLNTITFGNQAISWLSWGTDHSIRVWDLDSGKCDKILIGHTNSVVNVHVTADGRRAVSLSKDDTIRLWDLESAKCINTIEDHSARFEKMSVTADGRRAVSVGGGGGRELLVWDLENGKFIRPLIGHTDEVVSIRIAADGRQAASGAKDGTVRLWNLVKGQSINNFSPHYAVSSLCISADGRIVISGCDETPSRVWDFENRTEKVIAHGFLDRDKINNITPDNKKIITNRKHSYTLSGADIPLLRVWDLKEERWMKTLKKNEDVWATCIANDGRKLFTQSTKFYFNALANHSLLREWDIESGECIRHQEFKNEIMNSVNITPDCKSMVSGHQGGAIRVWDLSRRECVHSLQGHRSVEDVVVTPDGKRVVSRGHETLRVWDLHSGVCVRSISEVRGLVKSVVITPESKYAVSGITNHAIGLWNIETGDLIAAYQEGSSIISLSEVAAGWRFAVGTIAGNITFLTLRDVTDYFAVVTPSRIWSYGRNGTKGEWEHDISSLCFHCGHRFPVFEKLIDIIKAICRTAGISPEQSPCLHLPDEAWEEPGLLSECPHCHKPLKFNPFIVDNREIY